MEWSSPKKLLKIINSLKNQEKDKIKGKFIKNSLETENLMKRYKDIFLGYDY